MSGRPVKNLGQMGDHNTTLDHVPEPLSTPVPTPVSKLHSWTVARKESPCSPPQCYPCRTQYSFLYGGFISLTSIPWLRALHIDAPCNGNSSIRALHSDRPQNAPRYPEGLKAGPQVQRLRARGFHFRSPEKSTTSLESHVI